MDSALIWVCTYKVLSILMAATPCLLSSVSPSLYLKDDSTADHSGGDVLLLIRHPLDLAEFAVQLTVYVFEDRAHRAAGNVVNALTADDQEGQQNEAEEELRHQGPHLCTPIISK